MDYLIDLIVFLSAVILILGLLLGCKLVQQLFVSQLLFGKEQNRTARMKNRSILKTINVWFSFATVILCCIKTGYQVLKQVIYFSQTYSQGAHRIFAMLANIELEQIAQGCAIKIQHMAPFGENKCNSSSPRTDLIHLEIWL